MASRVSRKSEPRSTARKSLPISERQTSAYLMSREILRRIERSSTLAYLTSDAVTFHWSALGSGATVDDPHRFPSASSGPVH